MVELLCTLAGVIAGVAAVASLMQYQGDRGRFAAEPEADEADHMIGIADQLQVITHRVAADVTAHSEKVGHFNDRLSAPSADPEAVLSTLNDIITANQAMQGQLADAQKRIAQQSRMIEQASMQARPDALTGLANRRALNEFLTNSIAAAGDGTPTGLLLMDIDHFKSFNDNFGHATGDAVLASFARAIATCCGESSYAARYGGEEFAVVLSGASVEDVVRQAAEVRYFVSEQVISYEDLQLQVTASGGFSLLVPGDNISAVYERADEGLYQSKKAGRNCGHWLSPQGWTLFPDRHGSPRLLADLGATPLEACSDDDLQPQPTPQTPSPAAASGSPPQPRTAPLATSQPSSAPAAPPAAPATSPATVGPALTTQSTPPPAAADVAAPTQSAAAAEATAPEATAASTADPQTAKPRDEEALEVLDLNSFVGRLEAFLEQLRKADLPAAGFMLQAVGLNGDDPQRAVARWNQVLKTVQQNLRGLDVVSLYRPHTLCIFMPGCSLEACAARAAKIKSEVTLHLSTAPVASKLAIAVAAVGETEDNARFLNRLELALEEAQDAGHTELVIHDGNTCHYQSTH